MVSSGRSLARRAATVALVFAGAAAMAAGALALWVSRPLPAAMLARAPGEGVVLEDRLGRPLRATRATDGSQWRWVPYADIDADVIVAFVAVEDQRFWDHHGIDARAVVRAVRDNLHRGHVVSGASTLTMQLARLLRPTERSWGGKLAQACWALRIERQLGKQQILEQYLNRVHLGQAAVGVGAAAAVYDDASASELSLGQAATLAGLAHAPSRDNPYVSPRRARARRAYALRRMARLGFATREQVARAREEPLVVPPRTPPFLAPHFTTRVLALAGADTLRGGRLRTSLDLDLQREVEDEVRHTVSDLHERGVEQAAALVLDNATGEVLAWVGSPDFYAPRDGQTDMVVSPRQPGSALKPFLYGVAFDRGVTAATVLPDLPRAYATASGTYSPRNYDRQFRGPVRAREALASSYNVPAVELASRVGVGSLLETLRLAGFASLDRDAEHYGLGLALGNGEVTLVELANGYRALANGGVWAPWTWRATESPRPSAVRGRRVISPVASAIVLDILSDPSARIPGFGPVTPFDFPFRAAVKTGTSRHFTDNWAVGVTRGFTVAVWAGNFSGRPMQGVSGVTGAGPLLARVVTAAARRHDPGALPTPADAGAVAMPVCRLSGLRATDQCPRLTEWFAPGTAPTRDDDWERDGRVVLPEEYAAWASQAATPVAAGVMLAGVAEGTRELPTSGTNDAASAGERAPAASAVQASASSSVGARPRFRVTAPLDGDRYAIPAGVEGRYATIALRAAGPGAQRVHWFVDGVPFSGSRWPLAEGAHVVRAVSAAGVNDDVRITVVR